MNAIETGSSLASRRKKRNRIIFYRARFMNFFVKNVCFQRQKNYYFLRTVKNKKKLIAYISGTDRDILKISTDLKSPWPTRYHGLKMRTIFFLQKLCQNLIFL